MIYFIAAPGPSHPHHQEPPMDFATAMHEVEIEDACEALGLDDVRTSKVLQSFHYDQTLLHTMLAHDYSYRDYVRKKLKLAREHGIDF